MRGLALLACALLAACSSPEPLPEPPRPPSDPVSEPAAEPAAEPAPGNGAQPAAGNGAAPAIEPAPAIAYESVVSNAGTYAIRWRVADGALERGRDFALEIEVLRADIPGELANDVTLAIDAEMPEHRHGMSVVPQVVPGAPGTFRVEGMRFHMSGWWNLHLDVTRGPWTERAQVRIDLP